MAHRCLVRSRSTAARRALPAGVVLVALLLGGCGSGGAKSSTTATVASTTGPSAATTTQATTASAAAAPPSTASTSTAQNPTTKPDGFASADAICARRNRELVGISKAGASVRAILAKAPQSVAIQKRALEELHGLVPPQRVARDWHRVITETNAALRTTERLAHSSGKSEKVMKRQIARIDDTQLGLLAAGVRVGAKECESVELPSLKKESPLALP